MSTNITDRAAIVLQQIDARISVIAGNWPDESRALRCLKTAIEAVFQCSHFWQAAAAMWGENHPLKDAETRALEARDSALTTLCDQWRAAP